MIFGQNGLIPHGEVREGGTLKQFSTNRADFWDLTWRDLLAITPVAWSLGNGFRKWWRSADVFTRYRTVELLLGPIAQVGVLTTLLLVLQLLVSPLVGSIAFPWSALLPEASVVAMLGLWLHFRTEEFLRGLRRSWIDSIPTMSCECKHCGFQGWSYENHPWKKCGRCKSRWRQEGVDFTVRPRRW